ncbi:unnamed protein product [Amoebophrya sp. A25]|nr:unnamed protein product [Amoebophrya sp. A25]|eukprot:GSA25T00020760001.1
MVREIATPYVALEKDLRQAHRFVCFGGRKNEEEKAELHRLKTAKIATALRKSLLRSGSGDRGRDHFDLRESSSSSSGGRGDDAEQLSISAGGSSTSCNNVLSEFISSLSSSSSSDAGVEVPLRRDVTAQNLVEDLRLALLWVEQPVVHKL